jgi:hypothetical protein
MANGTVAFEPGDDICPPWWPFWWRRRWPKPPKELERFEQLHVVLTIHELAAQLGDAKLSKGIQELTIAAARKQVDSLGR